MAAIETIFVVAAVVVALIVVLGATRGGWTSETGYPEYQRDDEVLRAWWQRVTRRP